MFRLTLQVAVLSIIIACGLSAHYAAKIIVAGGFGLPTIVLLLIMSRYLRL